MNSRSEFDWPDVPVNKGMPDRRAIEELRQELAEKEAERVG
jgi:hypothetical protein